MISYTNDCEIVNTPSLIKKHNVISAILAKGTVEKRILEKIIETSL
jgi:hypothetical protein